MNIQVCRDTSDAVALYLPQSLYLKSFAKLNISIQLPQTKVHGKSISNWELMEKMRKVIQPECFSMLKVSKHTTEVIRFDAELENRSKIERVLSSLDGRVIKLNDYPDSLKVRVSETKLDFPSRHSWNSFFRDANDMDEMKPGERPDTIHISNLPVCWFIHERDADDSLPSENIFKKVFEKFGAIRQFDVPAADPYRLQMKVPMRGITIPTQNAALYFEGYIQFNEYVGFVRCMDALRGKKLLRKRADIAEWCDMHVDFDKTKHMTDAAVKRRAIVRERLIARQRSKDEEDEKAKEKIAKQEAKERRTHENNEIEKLAKMREREERRKKKQLAKLMQRDDVDLCSKVAEERKKLLKIQKKLQAVRLIEELFKRIELRPQLQRNGARRAPAGDAAARGRVVDKYKRRAEAALEHQRHQLQCALDGRIVIRSALETKKPRRESSISSLSSLEDNDRQKIIKIEKPPMPEQDISYRNPGVPGMYGLPGAFPFGYPFAPPPYHYPPQTLYVGRGDWRRARGRGRGRPRPHVPYFDGPDANTHYLNYFKKLKENESRGEHDDRNRSRSRSRSRRRSYTRSRSRSRSRSRRRSYTRSRSRSRSRARRSRRTRSHSRSRSRSRSRRRSRSRSRRSRSRSAKSSRTPERRHSPSPDRNKEDNDKTISPNARSRRSKSWSLPKDGAKSWSKSPKDK